MIPILYSTESTLDSRADCLLHLLLLAEALKPCMQCMHYLAAGSVYQLLLVVLASTSTRTVLGHPWYAVVSWWKEEVLGSQRKFSDFSGVGRGS